MRREAGWSLTELTIVLAVVAVLVYLSVRMLRPAEGQAFQQAELLRSDLRQVQMLALAQARSLQVKFGAAPAGCPAGSAYWVIACTQPGPDPCTGSPNTPITHPGTSRAFCVAPESGLGVTGSDIYFDALGRPKTGASFITSNASFGITGSPRSVLVAPVTGFATVQ